VDTIATNPNQADDPVGDPAEAAIQALLISVDDAQSGRSDGLSGPSLNGSDADGIADGGPAADQPERRHHLGRRDGACG
jgi:hypothetical protein